MRSDNLICNLYQIKEVWDGKLFAETLVPDRVNWNMHRPVRQKAVEKWRYGR